MPYGFYFASITLVAELNDNFSAFDRIVKNFGCERLRTIGDVCSAIAGIPDISDGHAHNVAGVALRIRRYMEQRNAAHSEEWPAGSASIPGR